MDSRFAFDLPAHRPQVRLAGAGDVEGMARVSVDTWRLTYTGILPAGYLARMRLPAHETQRRRLMGSPDTAHFVAEEPLTGETVGFASAGPARGGAGHRRGSAADRPRRTGGAAGPGGGRRARRRRHADRQPFGVGRR